MRLILIATPRAVTVRVTASTCGSIALAYSAVQEPAALSSTQSPCAWLLSKIPAVTAPLPLSTTHETTSAPHGRGREAETGPDALRRDFAVTPSADRTAPQGPH